MSGHSKWSNIKHRKQTVDSKRSARFQTLVNQIKLAATTNNNPETNSQLRNLIQQARKQNLPNDLIKRALGGKGIKHQATFFYELKFVKQLTVLIKITTDNSMRVLSQLRRILNKFPAELLPANSIQFEFQHLFVFELPLLVEEMVLELLNEVDLFNVVNQKTTTTIFIKTSEQARVVKQFLTLRQIQIRKLYEDYQPVQKIRLNSESVKKYHDFQTKIIEEIPSVTFFDNLAK